MGDKGAHPADDPVQETAEEGPKDVASFEELEVVTGTHHPALEAVEDGLDDANGRHDAPLEEAVKDEARAKGCHRVQRGHRKGRHVGRLWGRVHLREGLLEGGGGGGELRVGG